MKIRHVDKHYLYLRDNQICFFCGKSLKFGKVSIDHYLPRSHGGTDDVFNLVISCKSCNCSKKNLIPYDVLERHCHLFIQGVHDRKILCKSVLRTLPSELDTLVDTVFNSYISGKHTVFESSSHRFYVRDNLIDQIVSVHGTLSFLELDDP